MLMQCNVFKTIVQWETSLINLDPRFPKMYSTACDLDLKVIQIEGDYGLQFGLNKVEDMSGVKRSIFEEGHDTNYLR